MIVVDVNVLAYLLIPGLYTAAAERLLEADPQWAAPRLWRSELRNVMATYVRAGVMKSGDAVVLFDHAQALIGHEEYEPDTRDVLRLSEGSGASAYDCEYVALAEYLDVKLVTGDRKLARAFPSRVRVLAR